MRYCLNFPSVEYAAHEPLLHWQTEGKIRRQPQLPGGPLDVGESPHSDSQKHRQPSPTDLTLPWYMNRSERKTEIHRYVQVQVKTKKRKVAKIKTFFGFANISKALNFALSV